MLFACHYCGGQFCAEHRLPPSHRCIHEDAWRGGEKPAGSRPAPAGLSWRECRYCGVKTPALFFCPSCGNEYCWFHHMPADHTCPARITMLERNVPGERPGSAQPHVRVVVVLLAVAFLLIAVYSAFVFYETRIKAPELLPSGSGTKENVRTAPSSFSAAPVPVTVPATIPPVLREPPVFQVNPVPTPLAGVISYPSITEDSSRGTIIKNYSFSFQNRTVTISASVKKAVYNGAKNGVKTLTTSRPDIGRREYAPGYFRAFINDHHQDDFFLNLTTSLRKIRQDMRLSDDEYLELMAVFVQSLEYDTIAAANPDDANRFPVETFVDGKGVCGDKALLLGGLLAREHYDVVLLLFEPEKHMAIGIRSPANDYRNTSYAYLETTSRSLVGVVPDHLAGNIVLTSNPVLIPVGDGGRSYTATPQTKYIGDIFRTAESRIGVLEGQITSVGQQDPVRYNQLVAERNRYAVFLNYINSHEYDRPGTFAYVAATVPALFGMNATAPPVLQDEPVYATCNPKANLTCTATSRCCGTDLTCYSPCRQGTWSDDGCFCRV
jgi:hypothetical protein